jgi:Domain of unknown function (DUF4276)
MVTELRLYFEGDRGLKPGFHKFLEEIVELARSRRCKFQLVEAQGTPIQDFRVALKTHSDAWNVLLLDWEDGDEAAIRKRGLAGCDPDSVFWMVQIMESWFLADTEALKLVFKTNLNENALKRNPNVEEIPKQDVLDCLKSATGGRFHKVEHGVRLLASIHPAKVRKAAPDCDRMFHLILAKLS